jgi:hypothetical protein
MQSKASTVAEYLESLPADRRAAVEAVRKVILANLDKDYEEGMQYGMIGYYVPHSVYPPGYHCDPKQPLPFAGLASQKDYISIYLMSVYGDSEQLRQFREDWAKTGKKLNMGKSCIRIKKLEDLPLEVIGRAIARVPAKALIAAYQELRGDAGNARTSAKAAKSAPPRSTPATRQASVKSAPTQSTSAPRARAAPKAIPAQTRPRPVAKKTPKQG